MTPASGAGKGSGRVPHTPVLADAVLKWLDVRPGGTYVDCTAGAGGHSELIAQRLADGRLIALDRDPAAVELARTRLRPFPQAQVVHANYAQLASVLDSLSIRRVHGVLIDAGVSSMQIDDPERGFSLQNDGPLDMRMNPGEGITALEYLISTDSDELADVLRSYGDVKPARRIAKLLAVRAREGRIRTTLDLVRTV
ncbi:MAG: 16S rRNA (cytosine(1402)-N(4))-methyltransferase RsmH, partial [Bryobacteraceae bacterium]|nr:16S rRNA (cytosine(1402)-N(4))-methyltransferase RsmH [Bryobacteraceae bacterium]